MANNPLYFFVDIFNLPLWVVIWATWMAALNLYSVRFRLHRHGRVVLVAFLIAALLMMSLYGVFGLSRVLGVAHIVVWTPLLIWLIVTIRKINNLPLRRYLRILMATIFISLCFDYTDAVIFFSTRS